jgi:hypothetical protein
MALVSAGAAFGLATAMIRVVSLDLAGSNSMRVKAAEMRYGYASGEKL